MILEFPRPCLPGTGKQSLSPERTTEYFSFSRKSRRTKRSFFSDLCEFNAKYRWQNTIAVAIVNWGLRKSCEGQHTFKE